ncbi:MAG: hypothetical protein KGO96_05135 [Elusimicrobia bacterium]|nr:hypothetical protein [Elusimicrobiota bacterium]
MDAKTRRLILSLMILPLIAALLSAPSSAQELEAVAPERAVAPLAAPGSALPAATPTDALALPPSASGLAQTAPGLTPAANPAPGSAASAQAQSAAMGEALASRPEAAGATLDRAYDDDTAGSADKPTLTVEAPESRTPQQTPRLGRATAGARLAAASFMAATVLIPRAAHAVGISDAPLFPPSNYHLSFPEFMGIVGIVAVTMIFLLGVIKLCELTVNALRNLRKRFRRRRFSLYHGGWKEHTPRHLRDRSRFKVVGK